MGRFRLLIIVLMLTTYLDAYSFCRSHGELSAPLLSDGKTVQVGKNLVLQLNITDPEVDPSTVWLKLTDNWKQQRNLSAYLIPLQLSDNVLQWTVPHVTLNESGHYYVHAPAKSSKTGLTTVSCLSIFVGLAPSYMDPGSPDAQTDLYCVTYNYMRTSCWWDAGRRTNLRTSYTLYYATRLQAKFHNWKNCTAQLLMSSAKKRIMNCDPPKMTDSDEVTSWYYATEYVFFVKAENALGSSYSWNAATNNSFFVFDMASILQMTPPSDLRVPAKISSGDVVNCAWPKDALRVSDYTDALFAEISYDPLECPAANNRTVRVGMRQREGGDDKVQGLTPGLQYKVTARIRPNKTMIFDRDSYWSTPVVRQTVTADAPPTGVVTWEFSLLSLERAFGVEWRPLACELRGSATSQFQVEVTRNTSSDFYYNETATKDLSHVVKREDILPNAVYRVRIRALNMKGYGPWGDHRTIKTNYQPPENPPRNVTGSNVTSDGFVVTWRASKHANSPVTHYMVFVTNVEKKKKVEEEKVLSNSSELRYQVSGLAGWTDYSVSVKECAGRQCGQESTPRIITTRIGVPSNVTVQLDLDVGGNDVIGLKWEPPQPPNGPIPWYEVRFRPGSEKTENLTVTKWSKKMDCTSLGQGSKVALQVRAVNQNEAGFWSAPVEKSVCLKPNMSAFEISGYTLFTVVLVIFVILASFGFWKCRRKMQRERQAVPSDFTPPSYAPEPKKKAKAGGLYLTERNCSKENSSIGILYERVPSGESCDHIADGNALEDLGYPLTVQIGSSYGTSLGNANDTSAGGPGNMTFHGTGETRLDENSNHTCGKTRHVSTNSGVVSSTSPMCLTDDGDDKVSPSRQDSHDSGLSSPGTEDRSFTLIVRDDYNGGCYTDSDSTE